jgi:CheY-like chemotaxis protein
MSCNQGSRILVADDDMTTLLMIGAQLNKNGYVPIFSSDGQHAYETLMIDASIDVLITDVMMPRMNGGELIQKIRCSPSHAELPIIAISSVIGPREISTLLDSGADVFQVKPVDSDELITNIELVLKENHA